MSSRNEQPPATGDLLMPPPWTDPAPLGPITGGETNLLPRSAWSDPANPLKVRFNRWAPSNPGINDPESIRILLGTIEIGSKVWTAPIDDADHFVSISDDKLVPGEHQLTYVMTNWLGTPDTSSPFTITIDKQAPVLGNPNKLVFPAAVTPPNKITDTYLKNNQDKVLATLPRYADPKPGDTIRWYWGASQGDLNEAGVITLDHANYLAPIIVTVTGDLIRDRKDGKRYASYRVWDRSGNPSILHSEVAELDVAATPIPRVLPPSKVLEANGGSASGTLLPRDAVTGVIVSIPAAAVIHEGEQVSVQWAAPGTVGEFRTSTPVATGSRDYKIPESKIAQHLGKRLPVTYEVVEPGIVKPHVSQTYTLSVEELTGLPTVQCDKVSGGRLSLATVASFAEFTLERWSFMGTDQYITVFVRGVSVSNTQLDIPVLTQSPVTTVAQKIPVGQISKSDLQRFKLNTALQVRVSVSFDGKQTWKSFPMLEPTLVA